MNLLYSNDKRGAYPPSWYAATATPLAPFAPLKGAQKADVCVVGAGYTGLSAALHLAQAGRDVVLLDAQRVGFGASGRNGGQLGSGQRMEQDDLEQLMGEPEAAKLWDLGEDAKALVKSLITEHQIECHLKPGVAWTGSNDTDVKHLHSYADLLAQKYGYSDIETLDHAALQSVCPSPIIVAAFWTWAPRICTHWVMRWVWRRLQSQPVCVFTREAQSTISKKACQQPCVLTQVISWLIM